MFGKKKEKEMDAQIEALQKQLGGDTEASDLGADFNAQFESMMSASTDPSTEEGRQNIRNSAANFDSLAAGFGLDTKMSSLAAGEVKYDSESKEANELYAKANDIKDPKERFEVFLKCDELGHILGTYMAGQCFEKGFGTEKNISECIRLYEKAANQKVSRASKRLFEMYKSGDGIPKDKEKAQYWKDIYQKDAYTSKDIKSGFKSLFKK